MIMKFKVEVNNIPNETRRFVVARFVANELWYWGSWDNLEEAKRIAEELENGIVVERVK